MKVYVLFLGEDGNDYIPLYGVYSKREIAENIAEKVLSDNVFYDYLIEEKDLDEGVENDTLRM